MHTPDYLIQKSFSVATNIVAGSIAIPEFSLLPGSWVITARVGTTAIVAGQMLAVNVVIDGINYTLPTPLAEHVSVFRIAFKNQSFNVGATFPVNLTGGRYVFGTLLCEGWRPGVT